jgi:ribosomal protein L17
MFSRILSIEQNFRKHELEYDFEKKLSKIAKELSSRKNSYTRIFRIEVQRTFLSKNFSNDSGLSSR